MGKPWRMASNGQQRGWERRQVRRPGAHCHEFWSLCPSVPGGGVPQRSPGRRPDAPGAALPLRFPLLQQRHRAPLPGQDASFHKDVFSLSR